MKLVRKIAEILLLLFGESPVILFVLGFAIVGEGESTTSLFFMILFFVAFVSVPVAFIFYVIHAYRNKYFVKEQKNLWIAAFVFGSVLVYPFYWYLHIWRSTTNINRVIE